ncbi:oxalate oxidase [Gelatoporia subvermispora B]|uniref:Oxalate oxidase n=4 Tax=Ceriporiopsis subvermispora TaxID=42742 RepID=M2QJL8_CERS8|nr:oxalate oxidase [Gelatoporia subvermispora B]
MNEKILSAFCVILFSLSVAARPTENGPQIVIANNAGTYLPVLRGSGTKSSSAADATQTVPFASDDPNPRLWDIDTKNLTKVTPERGQLGAKILGPDNLPIDLQNADTLAPPTTDSGSIPNPKWPFALSHNTLYSGGWVRIQNDEVMPIAKAMAGVNMRLEAGAIRELHWHNTPEWAYILKGTTQITAVDQNGRNYLANVGPGDLWYFPEGMPHSLQGTDANNEGSEFLLIFPDGTFDSSNQFMITDWLAHTPKDVIAKNFGVDISEFDRLPSHDLYIFPGVAPPLDAKAPEDPQGTIPLPYSFEFSKVKPTQYAGGTVKIADTRTFPIAKTISVAEVTVEPGAMRELHWHPTEDEWTFFIEGQARVTIFAGQSNAQTYDYQGGDIAYIPTAWGHYVENSGNTTLRFLEIFNSPLFEDVSLAQWIANTPPAIVKATLQLSDEVINTLNKSKAFVVG